jgi:hypothetical protein
MKNVCCQRTVLAGIFRPTAIEALDYRVYSLNLFPLLNFPLIFPLQV